MDSDQSIGYHSRPPQTEAAVLFIQSGGIGMAMNANGGSVELPQAFTEQVDDLNCLGGQLCTARIETKITIDAYHDTVLHPGADFFAAGGNEQPAGTISVVGWFETDLRFL